MNKKPTEFKNCNCDKSGGDGNCPFNCPKCYVEKENNILCCDNCKPRQDIEMDSNLGCSNPDCPCHHPTPEEVNDWEEGLRKALRWPEKMDVLSPDGDSRGSIERAVDFIRSQKEKSFQEGYKQGIKDEVECIEKSGEHGVAVLKIKQKERDKLRGKMEKFAEEEETRTWDKNGRRLVKLVDILEIIKE